MKIITRIFAAVTICVMMLSFAGCAGSKDDETTETEGVFSKLAIDWDFDYADNAGTITEKMAVGPSPSFVCTEKGEVTFAITPERVRTGTAELQEDGSYFVTLKESRGIICTVEGDTLKCQVEGRPDINIYFKAK